ncbi:hypothetical protein IW261DRAFT_991768 [Armillaria novae-zelandiae]|uniref:F-box domain-containing protein n=1 Tax=Armillaria novae-zelandiae TaxID=153914 RepID=A0AA39PGU8_9AGAR|nr:hypothetical protein IW261DRAFT_991768 [Armillaria novae-zelandiae]
MAHHTWSPRICLGCDCPNHHSPSATSCDEETAHAIPTFDNLLRSNHSPSPSEECQLRDSISVGEAHVAAIDDHIAELKKLQQALSSQIALIGAEMEGLGNKREKVVVRITEYKRFLSPIRRLPLEILLQIFRGTIIFPIPRTRSQRERYRWDFHPSKSSLWSIELVCKTWRRVVLDFPELWSSINISLSDENFLSYHFRYVRQLAGQVARSRCHPLSIHICSSSRQTSASSKSLPLQLSTLLFAMQDRIQSLYLYLPATMFASVATLQLHLPILRKLTLLSTNGEVFQMLSHLKLFGDTPLLTVLDTVDIQNIVSAIDLPYHQITRYSTYHASSNRFYPGPSALNILSFLSETRNIEACDLRCETQGTLETFGIEDHSQTCSKLQALALSSWACACPSSVLAQLLNALTLPRLSTLEVDCRVDRCIRDTVESFTAIRRAIHRSQSPLTTFHFTHGDIDEEDLLALFLIASSTLEEVKLLDVGPRALTDGILAPLVISDADNVLLPILHTLHISGEMQFDANLLAEMVKSRWTCRGPSFRRLRTIVLRRAMNIADDREEEEFGCALALSKLEEYCTEGLKLSYSIL